MYVVLKVIRKANIKFHRNMTYTQTRMKLGTAPGKVITRNLRVLRPLE